jgi:hypothetical protein
MPADLAFSDSRDGAKECPTRGRMFKGVERS